MSRDHKQNKRRKNPDDYDAAQAPKKSLVDYSRVSRRPEAASGRSGGQSKGAPSGPIGTAAPDKMSAQMVAVVHLMAGVWKRERSPKNWRIQTDPALGRLRKANEDKLNLEGVDHKKTEEYRRDSREGSITALPKRKRSERRVPPRTILPPQQ